MSLDRSVWLHGLLPNLRAVVPVLLLIAALLALGWWGATRHPAPELVITGPNQAGIYLRTAERLITEARTRVLVMMYVVRVDDTEVGVLLEALAAAQRRGIVVQVVLDRSNRFGSDEPDTKNNIAMTWLKTRGVDARWDELSRTSHAKILIADDTALLGSHNWTRAALTSNREVSVLLRDPQMIATLAHLITAVPSGE